MKKWYENKYVGIYFDKIPLVAMRYYIPSMQNDEKISVKKYPFINKQNLNVKLVDYKDKKEYFFEIPKGYCFDGASIPKIFWRIIGSNTDNSFLIPALIHDVLCENHYYINNDKNFSTQVFNALLEANNVLPLKRFCMKHSVNLFQGCCGKWNKKKV